MKRFIFLFVAFGTIYTSEAQELYIYTEPASNIPAKSISLKLTSEYMPPQQFQNRSSQRYKPEVMLGLHKNLMVKAGVTFADVNTEKFRWESVFGYAKYRFLSKDDFYSHFRMAAFIDAAYSRSPFRMEEVNLNGDRSGVQAGIIATKLIHKLAVSSTISHTQVLHNSRWNEKDVYTPERIYQAMNYSLSAGYLVFPVEYKNYDQVNLNLYAELLAQQSLDRQLHYIDLAPAAQLIIKSNTKINLGYRFQINGNMKRMAENAWLLSYERTFFNALKKKRKP